MGYFQINEGRVAMSVFLQNKTDKSIKILSIIRLLLDFLSRPLV